jgi:micrococcal nuclease
VKTRWALLLVALSLASCSPPPSSADLRPPAITLPGRPATVTRVIDGDTIEAELDGRVIDVRLIGIDTPETVHPSEPVECFGAAASRFTTTMLNGRKIRLEFDVERTDQYGRTLAYVWLGDELFNEVLVRQGFAQVSTYPPNVKYVDDFLAAQRDARSASRSLWGSQCALEGHGAGGGGGTGAGGGGNCDPSYPDVCIAPYPPDLDCADVPYTNFQVTGSDPHGFDGNSKGVGCET